jgi:hypothetical protein
MDDEDAVVATSDAECGVRLAKPDGISKQGAAKSPNRASQERDGLQLVRQELDVAKAPRVGTGRCERGGDQ